MNAGKELKRVLATQIGQIPDHPSFVNLELSHIWMDGCLLTPLLH